MREAQRRVRALIDLVAAETRLQLGFQAARPRSSASRSEAPSPRLALTVRVEPGASPYRQLLNSRTLGEDINRSTLWGDR
jgi:hypothetical protein